MVPPEPVELHLRDRIGIDVAAKHALRNRTGLLRQIRFTGILDRHHVAGALSPAFNCLRPSLSIGLGLLEHIMAFQHAIAAKCLA